MPLLLQNITSLISQFIAKLIGILILFTGLSTDLSGQKFMDRFSLRTAGGIVHGNSEFEPAAFYFNTTMNFQLAGVFETGVKFDQGLFDFGTGKSYRRVFENKYQYISSKLQNFRSASGHVTADFSNYGLNFFTGISFGHYQLSSIMERTFNNNDDLIDLDEETSSSFWGRGFIFGFRMERITWALEIHSDLAGEDVDESFWGMSVGYELIEKKWKPRKMYKKSKAQKGLYFDLGIQFSIPIIGAQGATSSWYFEPKLNVAKNLYTGLRIGLGQPIYMGGDSRLEENLSMGDQVYRNPEKMRRLTYVSTVIDKVYPRQSFIPKLGLGLGFYNLEKQRDSAGFPIQENKMVPGLQLRSGFSVRAFNVGANFNLTWSGVPSFLELRLAFAPGLFKLNTE